jgi:hypothetical protein
MFGWREFGRFFIFHLCALYLFHIFSFSLYYLFFSFLPVVRFELRASHFLGSLLPLESPFQLG